jgi:hypothetical protein
MKISCGEDILFHLDWETREYETGSWVVIQRGSSKCSGPETVETEAWAEADIAWRFHMLLMITQIFLRVAAKWYGVGFKEPPWKNWVSCRASLDREVWYRGQDRHHSCSGLPGVSISRMDASELGGTFSSARLGTFRRENEAEDRRKIR